MAGIESAYPKAMDRLMAETLASTRSATGGSSAATAMNEGSDEDDGDANSNDDNDDEEDHAGVAGDMASEIVKLVGSGARRHHKVAGAHLSLFLSLQHAEPTVRAAAVKQLRDTLPGNSDQVEAADRLFFRDALEARSVEAEPTRSPAAPLRRPSGVTAAAFQRAKCEIISRPA